MAAQTLIGIYDDGRAIMTNATKLAVGDYVTWAEPTNEKEGNERYIVTEVNDDRCFIEFVCDLPFPPVTMARTADLVDVYSRPSYRLGYSHLRNL